MIGPVGSSRGDRVRRGIDQVSSLVVAMLLTLVSDVDLSIELIGGEDWRFRVSRVAGWVPAVAGPIGVISGLISLRKASVWQVRLA